MKTFSLLIVFWLLPAVVILGIEFVSESIGESAQNMILIPYQDLFFSFDQEEKVYQNTLTLVVYTADEDIVFEEEYDLSFTVAKPELDALLHAGYDREFYPLQFQAYLAPGHYHLYVSISGNDTSKRREYRKEFVFPDKRKEVGYFFVTGEIDDFLFILRDSSYLYRQFDSLSILQHLDFTPDSAKVVVTLDDYQIIMQPEEFSGIGEYINNQTSFDIELINFYQNRQFVSTPVFPNRAYFFQQQYTPKEQLVQLRYVINQNEYQYLRSLSDEELQNGINQYWESNDPDPYTSDNIYQETFYQRVRYADNNYQFRRYQPGWRSDMGRIYIIYGKPNHISSDVFPVGRPPSITWYYYSLNKVFEFYDLRGYGNYELKDKWID